MCSEYPTGLPKRNSHSRFPDHQWIIARIVEDGICFSLVKNKMQKWRDRGRQLREQSKAELLCAVMMEAAAEKSAQDSGTGFLVGRHEMSQALSIDETAFRNLFRNVKWRLPCEFEDLQRFAQSFGYSMSVVEVQGNTTPQDHHNWGSYNLSMRFTPEFQLNTAEAW